jgi:hypothetical protein
MILFSTVFSGREAMDAVHKLNKGVSMTLSKAVPSLLDKCAHAIVLGEKYDINLTALFPTFYREGGMVEIVTTLTERVEYYSDGARTVRLADKTLFRHEIKNTGLYLVRCSAGASKDIVTKLSDDMKLVMLRPCGDGLTVGAMRASSRATARLGLALEAHFKPNDL